MCCKHCSWAGHPGAGKWALAGAGDLLLARGRAALGEAEKCSSGREAADL